MNLTIAIFTFRRIDTQITYDNIPKEYKDQVRFVVQKQEEELFREKYPKNDLFVVDDNIGLPNTRQVYYEAHPKETVWMLDDDLNFMKKYINEEDKIKTKHPISLEDFEEIINWIETTPYNHGGLMANTFYARGIYDDNYKTNSRNHSNTFYKYGNIQDVQLDYQKFLFAEDYHTMLQLIEGGYKNIIHTRYLVGSKSYASGGCDAYRTLQNYNECMRDLRDYWSPEIIRFRKEKEGRVKFSIAIKKLWDKRPM